MDGTLYFECYSGISGDMAVAAMLDLGADQSKLMDVLDSLPLDGYSVRISRRMKSGLDVMDFDVVLDEDNHDHDMGYLYGDVHEGHHHHHHLHRGMAEITDIISKGRMTDGARSIAMRIFSILAEAEARAHGVPVDEVHFHEVGAVDSIVDIVSLAVCIDDLSPEGVCFSDLYEGTGTVRCQHGVLPVPVPAVTNIASEHGLRMRITSSQGEFVTPTGAAFAAAVGTCDPPTGPFTISRTGMGAGKRETDRSGILRAMIIGSGDGRTKVCKIECNIDDCSGETLGYTMERLLSEGAMDVFCTPIVMKKSRPAHTVTVLCSEEDADRMTELLFRETTTIGVRRIVMDKIMMDRRIETVDSPIGKVDVKVCSFGDVRRWYPEYESLKRICSEKGMSYSEAYSLVTAFCREVR